MNATNRAVPLRWMSIALLAFACAAPATDMAQAQISPEMRAQARKVAQACKADLKQFCQGVQRGDGRIIACLQANETNLAPACQSALAEALPK